MRRVFPLLSVTAVRSSSLLRPEEEAAGRHTESRQTDSVSPGNQRHQPVAKVVLEVPGDQRHGELVGAVGVEDVELLGGRRRHLEGGGTRSQRACEQHTGSQEPIDV